MKRHSLLLLALLAFLFLSPAFSQDTSQVPSLPREFRGVWVSTIFNLDWPSSKTAPPDQQRRELIAIMDKAKELNLNAVIFQVRPAGDALYRSNIEPWSAYLTGTMGKAPEPMWDPLAVAVEEAHKRGLELHAWINPYRALASKNQTVADNHISKRRPDLVVDFADSVLLNPGEQQTADYNVQVVMDIVKRYDIDGIQFDDYFYPYPKEGVTFNDAASYQKYKSAGGTLSLADWRRENVNKFIQRVYTEIKKEKPHVKFGVSPFGIWKSGTPESVRGLSAYDELYADTRKWLNEGWVDYFAPQLYWPIDAKQQSFPVLFDWWLQQNPKGRYVWPGLATYKIEPNSKTYSAQEIVNEITTTHSRPPQGRGHLHFRYKWLQNDTGGVATALKKVYTSKALVPPLTWIDNTPPSAPRVNLQPGAQNAAPALRWQNADSDPVKNWVVYAQINGKWWVEILPAQQTSMPLRNNANIGILAVSAVDLAGNESPKATVSLGK